MSIARRSLAFASGTLVSRIFGLLREAVIAGSFGAGLPLDAFLVAQRIPNLMREMLAEGALGASFTKVFSSLQVTDPWQAKQLFTKALLATLGLAIIITCIGILSAEFWVNLLTLHGQSQAEISPEFYHDSVILTRWFFPFIGLMMISALCAAVLHSYNRYLLSSLSPVGVNIGYLCGAIFLSPWIKANASQLGLDTLMDPGIAGLVFGALVGGCLQLGVQAIVTATIFKKIPPTTNKTSWRELKEVWQLMGPMIIAASAGQINILVNTNYASALGPGAISWLALSFRLVQLPIGLFAVALGSVALPDLTRSIAAAGGVSTPSSAKLLRQSSELLLWLLLPCLCFLLQNTQPIVTLLYEHGRFSSADRLATAAALYGYSFGLIGYGLVKVLSVYYYAINRTRYAMRVSLVCIGINVITGYICSKYWGHQGLAFSFSLLLIIQALLLAYGLKKDVLHGLNTQLWFLIRHPLTLTFTFGLSYLTQAASREQFQAWAGVLAPNFPKIQAAFILGANSVIIAGVFIPLGLWRLKMSPSQAIKRLLKR